MSEKKPVPTIPRAGRIPCPVCGQASYSAGGVHPQCAAARADAKLQAARKTIPAPAKAAPPNRWTVACPKCKRRLPARRYVCDCGHALRPSAAK